MKFGELAFENKNPFLCSAEPEGSEDGGGDTGEKPQPDITKLFSDFSAEMKKTFTALTTRLDKVEKGSGDAEFVKNLQSEINELKQKLEDRQQEREEGGDDDKTDKQKARDNATERQMKRDMAKLQEQLQEQGKLLGEERDRRVTAENQRRDDLASNLIKDALIAADAIDPVLAAETFKHRVQWREDEGKHLYKSGEDWVEIKDGIAKDLPKYMRKAQVNTGGSGGKGSGSAGATTRSQLKQAAVEASIQAQSSGGGQTALSRYQEALNAAKEAGVTEQEVKDAVRMELVKTVR